MNSIIKERIEKIEEGIIPEGYKKTKVGIIPKDWEVKKLGDISKFIDGDRGKNYPNKNDLQADGVFFLSTKNIVNNKLDLSNVDYISEDKYKTLKKGNLNYQDIIITMRGSIGNVALYTNRHKAFINAQLGIIRSDKVAPEFITNEFILSKNKSRLINLSTGSAQPQLTKGIIENFELSIPPLHEQEEISHILSTWDRAIENIEKLINEKETQKKGLMQELLTGKTRLAGFTDDWEEVKLGDVSKVVSGGTPSTNNADYWNGDIYWATPTDITGSGKFINSTIKSITPKGLKNSSANLLPVNSILMTSRATIGQIAINTEPMATNQGFKSLICKDNSCHEYLYYLIKTLEKDFIRMSTGSTFLEISKKDTEDIKISLPPLPEQEAIAEILSTADKEIELLNQLLEAKKEEKKGLMQLLLTGIVRV